MQVPYNGRPLWCSHARTHPNKHTHTHTSNVHIMFLCLILLGPGMQQKYIKDRRQKFSRGKCGWDWSMCLYECNKMNHLTLTEKTSRTWKTGFKIASSPLVPIRFYAHVRNSRGNQRLCVSTLSWWSFHCTCLYLPTQRWVSFSWLFCCQMLSISHSLFHHLLYQHHLFDCSNCTG